MIPSNYFVLYENASDDENPNSWLGSHVCESSLVLQDINYVFHGNDIKTD